MKDAGVSQGITFRTLHDEEPVGSEVSGMVSTLSVIDEVLVSCKSGILALLDLIGSIIVSFLGLSEGGLGIIHLFLGESSGSGSVCGSGSSFNGSILGRVSGTCGGSNKGSMGGLIRISLISSSLGDAGVVRSSRCLEFDSSCEDFMRFYFSLSSSNLGGFGGTTSGVSSNGFSLSIMVGIVSAHPSGILGSSLGLGSEVSHDFRFSGHSMTTGCRQGSFVSGLVRGPVSWRNHSLVEFSSSVVNSGG